MVKVSVFGLDIALVLSRNSSSLVLWDAFINYIYRCLLAFYQKISQCVVSVYLFFLLWLRNYELTLRTSAWSDNCQKMGAYSKLSIAFRKYPLLRGMLAYSIIWPSSSLFQQTFEGKTVGNLDLARCARYGFYGTCYVAPTVYSWLTIASIMWPGNSVRAGLIKTFVESLTYTPFAMSSFYFFMSLLESKPFHEALAEVKSKFVPTYKAAVCFWPVIAMTNFCLIPQRNRVVFISMCSFVWICFLAHMKHSDKEPIAATDTANHIKLIKIEKS